MNRLVRQTAVIARRDFVATVFTPTFLLFLLAPFVMLGFGLVGGLGAAQMTRSADARAEIVAIAAPNVAARLRAADEAAREANGGGVASLRIVAPEADTEAQARRLLGSQGRDVYAVLSGPLERPLILRTSNSRRSAFYLAELAEQALRADRAGLAVEARLSEARIRSVERAGPTGGNRQALGFTIVFGLFFLTLLLAGQTVGMLAEEKGNKVIEILAAATALEAVFLGKLIGMFGVAVLFILFWGALALGGVSILPGGNFRALDPAVGLPAFAVLAALYFTMSYLLLGAVFLGAGAQASSVREIQMLSLPITIFQVGMFGVGAAAAANAGGTFAFAAEIFPFSSPYAMAARAATDPRLWPHILGLAWQLMWVTITITVAARLFRRGVLKSGSKPLFGRQARARPEQLPA